MDGGRTGVACVHDDVRAVGQRVDRGRPSRRGTARRGRGAPAAATVQRGRGLAGHERPPCRQRDCQLRQRLPQIMGMDVRARHERGGAADRQGRDAARASSSPARAVTVSRVPTIRHNALSRTAPATPGWPITPVTPSAEVGPGDRDSLASGTVASRASSTARSRSSSSRASSRATCSPAMIVTGPRARRSARTIGCGSPDCRSADPRSGFAWRRCRPDSAGYLWAAR